MNFKPYENTKDLYKRFDDLYGETTESQKKRYDDLFDEFKRYFNVDSAFFASSSGRVEVCGNHTDHNGGVVVSCAISLDTLAAFLPTNDDKIVISSQGYDEISVDLRAEPTEQKGTSAALVRGVSVGLFNSGRRVGGFIAKMTSNVVGGAGISSSASFEVLIAEILSFLYNDGKVSEEEKAKVSQYAESVYFGKPCGLLDQTAIAFGGLNRLDFYDKNKIGVKRINADTSDYTFVLVNTGGSHANLTDEYAAIPKEMKAVANLFGKERLIEISESDFYLKLPEIIDKVSDRAILRAVHFYSENKRVDKLADALINGEEKLFFDTIKDSGISSALFLQNCRVDGSLEQLVMRALAITNRFLSDGANRVHGGGFAGTILCVLKNENVDYFIENVSKFYDKNAIIPLKIRKVGTTVL